MRDEVRDFIFKNFLFDDSGDSLNDSDSFLEKGIIDSTGMLELVAFLEEKYGIRIEDDELVPENLDSVERLVQFISRKKVPS
ncbi:MAG: acyl carrier protein [Deltaproteobacteria bacterium]|nr:acyl carrier protein [Deltaproteobacteria bacterium]